MTEKKYISTLSAKAFAKLKQKKYREESGLFIAEGIKICEELIASDYICTDLIIDEKLISNEQIIEDSRIQKLLQHKNLQDTRILLSNEANIKKIADTMTPQGIIAIAKTEQQSLNRSAEQIVVLENIQDPGNLGTIIRTADWFGIRNILISSSSVDIYNPKVIRSAMGSIFHLNIEYSDDIISYCETNFPEHTMFASSLATNKTLDDIHIPEKVAIFFGNEGNGLSQSVLDRIDTKYIIKGAGNAESLNLSIAAGISLYHFTKNRIK